MAWPICNMTEENELIDEEAIWHAMTFHHLGLVSSAVFTLGSIFFSWYLIYQHARHYLKPWQQRHIIRVLFTIPIYSTVSFFSYLSYQYAIYFEVLRDCYEAFAIASFFALLCSYIAPDLHCQKDYFRLLQPNEWAWPINWFGRWCPCERRLWRTPRSGLTWFNIIWFGVFQYCFVRVLMSLVAVITQATGRYCSESLHPAFAYIWVMLIEGGSVTIAMYCLVQFYMQLKGDLAEHKPLLKITAVKLVIFLSFWQTVLITTLVALRFVKPSSRIATPDIKIGIPSLLLCAEMAMFSVFHLWAFPWGVYDIRNAASEPALRLAIEEPAPAYSGGPLGIQALLDAFNLWDLVKAIGRGFRWFAVGRRIREQDISYKKSGRTVALEPLREAVAIPLPFPSNDPSDRKDDDTQLSTGHSSACNDHSSLVDEEEDIVAEENNNLPNAPCFPQSNPYPHPPQDQTNHASDDITTESLHSQFTNHPQDPCSRPATPPPTQPESPTLDPNSRKEDPPRFSTDANISPGLLEQNRT